jgi:molecular chaperone HtpG
MAEKKSYKFKAEVNQLLDILVHSLYTNREIFLRELVSNASDALDKLRFEQTKGTKVNDPKLKLQIKIEANKDKNILVITDTGIGMTRDEIVKNIGTIAKSGSADFLKQLSKDSKDQKDISNIIGKFGVGFYSVFMVAEEVVIKTKSFQKDAAPVEWRSKGIGKFEITELDENIERGAQIEIYLKEEFKDFTEDYRIESTIKQHSNFVQFPIFLGKNQVNKVSALWREPKPSIKREQYDEFYKFLTHDTKEPLETLHVSIDAPVQFNSLMFYPKTSFDFLGYNKDDMGLDLYVQNVLIQHKNSDLLPEYLGFIKGMVDSPDIPLNISRETLQENQVIMKISQILVKQVLSNLEKMAKKEPERYQEFWGIHSKSFKLCYQDFANHEKLTELVRFNSSVSEDEKSLTSFAEYVERAKEDQKEIYYITGASREALTSDPHLEIFRRKGIEVLYLYEPIDEFLMSGFGAYKKDYKLTAVEQADLSKIETVKDVVEKESTVEKMTEGEEKVFDKFIKKVKDILGARVKDVVISKRLQDSASCLVSPDGGMTSHMHKMMQMMNKDASIPEKIFEINKDHELTRNLLKIYKNDPKDYFIVEAVEQMFESALLLEGYLNDPHQLVNRINDVLLKSSSWHPGKK